MRSAWARSDWNSYRSSRLVRHQPGGRRSPCGGGARWLCRSLPEPGRWLHLGVSPASASNLEWFVTELLSIPGAASLSRGHLFDLCELEVREAAKRPREVWYPPYPYASPLDNRGSAAFVGLRGWHTRADLTRALFDGVVFNPIGQVSALETAFTLREARLTGGGSRSATWSQMFAAALGLPVTIAQSEESGFRGAALWAGVGVGRFDSLAEATETLVAHAADVRAPGGSAGRPGRRLRDVPGCRGRPRFVLAACPARGRPRVSRGDSTQPRWAAGRIWSLPRPTA